MATVEAMRWREEWGREETADELVRLEGIESRWMLINGGERLTWYGRRVWSGGGEADDICEAEEIDP